jgi:hypothetical protein
LVICHWLPTVGPDIGQLRRYPWGKFKILDTSDSPKSWQRAILQTPLAAGYRKHRGNAARLSANEHVKDRVKEIQAIGAERAAVTVQSLIEEAEQARIKAMESQNGSAAAVSAITAKAKLAGLWREKADQHSTGTISTVWQVSWEDEEDGGRVR